MNPDKYPSLLDTNQVPNDPVTCEARLGLSHRTLLSHLCTVLAVIMSIKHPRQEIADTYTQECAGLRRHLSSESFSRVDHCSRTRASPSFQGGHLSLIDIAFPSNTSPTIDFQIHSSYKFCLITCKIAARIRHIFRGTPSTHWNHGLKRLPVFRGICLAYEQMRPIRKSA